LKKGKVKLSATAGSILSYKGEGVTYLSPEKQRDFWSGVGKLLHLSKWSRPDIKNSVQELSRGMTQATGCSRSWHPAWLLHVVVYFWWSGCEDDKLIIKGIHNVSDYNTRRSVMGRATFLNGAPIIV
jgi:hypothetical protein